MSAILNGTNIVITANILVVVGVLASIIGWHWITFQAYRRWRR